MFIWGIIYHMICFAGLIEEASTLELVGWSAIVTLTVNLVVNFSFVIGKNCKSNIRQIRTRWLTRRRDALKKEIEERDELDRKEQERAWQEYQIQQRKIEKFMRQAQLVLAEEPPAPRRKKVRINRRLIEAEPEPESVHSFRSIINDDWIPPMDLDMPQRTVVEPSEPALLIIEEEEPS